MLTPVEKARLDGIKMMVHAGLPLEAEEKQWVLDLGKREGVPVEKRIAQNAELQGFNVHGLRIAA